MPQRRDNLVPERQQPLRQRYRDHPREAWISDHARAVAGNGTDPFHGEIEPANGTRWCYGIHRAVGGDHDAPNPGDLLSAALAACLHSTTRMQADWLDLELTGIEVAATAEADVRGCLMVDRSVPVGFQRMHCKVHLEVAGEPPAQALRSLMTASERACVIMQTLQRGTKVRTDWQIERAANGRDDRNSNPTHNAEASS